MSEEWRDSAACANDPDPEIWFPEGETDRFRKQIELAKLVCSRCDVRGRCLSYATDNGLKDGIWGGMTPKERANAVRRRQRMVAKVVAL